MRILITSAGGLVGTFLIKHYRESRCSARIIATDISEHVPAKLLADEFYLVPSSSNANYEHIISEIVLNENPEVIIPGSSYDVTAFAAFGRKYENRMLIMDEHYNTLFHNKETSYEQLKKLSILVPKVYSEEDVKFPCVLKPKIGTGSKNTIIVESQNDLDYWQKRVMDGIICEYLHGDEYTVDCLFDKTGRCIGYNTRQRNKQVSGATVISKNASNDYVKDIVAKLECAGIVRGPVNFQFKLDTTGRPVVFDFNTRFASGGLPLTVASGFDIPNKLIDEILGLKVQAWTRDEEHHGKMTMVRYYEEIFFNE